MIGGTVVASMITQTNPQNFMNPPEVILCTILCDLSDHLQESLGPPGPKSQKSHKKSLLGGLKKVPENTPKSRKIPFFRYFRGLFCRPTKRLFLTLFWGISGLEGPATPVNGRSGRKPFFSKSLHLNLKTIKSCNCNCRKILENS